MRVIGFKGKKIAREYEAKAPFIRVNYLVRGDLLIWVAKSTFAIP